MKWLVYFMALIFLTFSANALHLCQQEFANVSTSCGGLGNGTYEFEVGWLSQGALVDGDYTTYGWTASTRRDFWMNYRIGDFQGAIWAGTHSGGSTNFSIPDDCWNRNSGTLRLMAGSAADTGSTYWWCVNATASKLLLIEATNEFLYEESIYWIVKYETIDMVVVNSTYDAKSISFTSDGQQSCGWKETGGYVTCGDTIDKTPTFNFDTYGRAVCKLWNESINFTGLGSKGIANCSTTDSTNHICTFPANLTLGTHTLYVSCEQNGVEMYYFNASNVFNVSIITSNITLDGSQDNQTYEYETTASISVGLDLLTVFDFTNRYINVTSPLSYLIDILRVELLDSKDKNYNISVDPRADLYRAEFNISSDEDLQNLSLDYTDTIYFPGLFYRNVLQQERFHFEGKDHRVLNISFITAGIKTIKINFTSHGNKTRKGIFNLTITGADLDSGNDMAFTSYLNQSMNTSNATFTGTFAPLGSMGGLNNSWENFQNNDTNFRWNRDQTYTNDTSICRQSVFGGDTTCNLYETSTASDLFYQDAVDLSTVNVIKTQVGFLQRCTSTIQPSTYIVFSDLTTEKIVVQESFCCGCPGGSDSQLVLCNMTFSKISSTIWNVSSVGTRAACQFEKTVDVADLTPPYYLALKSGQAGIQHDLLWKTFNINGIMLNKTNGHYHGIQGPWSANISGNFTSHNLIEGANSISRATLTYDAYFPTGSNIVPYMSNDNTTWETITNGSTHVFTSSGNGLRVRFELHSTQNYTTPIVQTYSVDIVSSAMKNLTIDIGSDGTFDFNVSFPLNSSNTPVHFGNDSSLNDYIFNNCNLSAFCEIPITFTAGSGGIIEIRTNLTQDVNPIRLNTTLIQDLNDINITISSTNGTVPDLTFSNFKFDYRGQKNITVSAFSADQTIVTNRTLVVRYSPFNITFPSGVEWWELFPSSRNQTDIEPYGQNSTHGIFQIDTIDYHQEGIDVYVRYNESIDSCVTQNNFQSTNYSNNTNLTVNLTTVGKKVIENLNDSGEPNYLWTYTNINCSESTNSFAIPYFCFWSLCTDCVLTSDRDDTCAGLI